jgi:hypothetical protein
MSHTPIHPHAPGYCAGHRCCPQCNGTGFRFYGGRKPEWSAADFAPCDTCDNTGWRNYHDQRAALIKAETA